MKPIISGRFGHQVIRLSLTIIIIGIFAQALNAMNPKEEARLRSRAASCIHNQRYDRAADLYKRLLNSETAQPFDLQNYIRALIRAGKQQEGINYLQSVWTTNQSSESPDSLKMRNAAMLLAELHVSMGDDSSAARYWKWYENQLWGNLDRMSRLIEHFTYLKKDDVALDHIHKWRKQMHQRHLWGNEAGNILRRHQDFTDAFKEYSQELESDPGKANLLIRQISSLPYPADSS